MPNPNYIKGRAFEYARKAVWEEMGYLVIRASGSHGDFDLVAIKPLGDVTLIQCKVTNSEAEAERLLRMWRDHPPLTPCKGYHQTLEVKVLRNGIRSITV